MKNELGSDRTNISVCCGIDNSSWGFHFGDGAHVVTQKEPASFYSEPAGVYFKSGDDSGGEIYG